MENKLDIIIDLLKKSNAKIEEIEARLNRIEAQSQPPSPGQPPPPEDENV